MPLYEYACPQCERFEVIQRFSDSALSRCPTCGSSVQKLPSAPAIQFKGSGWYVTDYAKRSGHEAAGKKGETRGSDVKESSTSTPTSSPSKENSATTGSSPTK